MGDFVAHLYIGLAQVFADLLPRPLIEKARTGPLWRRIVIALFFGVSSLIIGLVVAALALFVIFVLGAVGLGVFRAILP
ncbi:hypothetical protein LZ518_09775 [Sphingomonas sp. RB56-2]|uniref:Uncharacterized protein n=1 Tax=Sphingomonas brevis TaxID=2908206 RepID=A0ABT0SAQ3_9SPHN|nr:hypothetical protein [Sphingomonas brevis]MCL6741418.1 hypothetical protein [Sphingomonas brevis]